MTRITASAFALLLVAGSALGADLYWVGSNGNWSDPAHWSLTSGGAGGAGVPGATDNVFFDANSSRGKNKQCTIDQPVSVLSLTMTVDTRMALAQGNNAVTVGAGGVTVAGGSFDGGTAAIAIGGPLSLIGGTLTSTSGTLSLAGNLTLSGGTFSHNGGSILFNGTSTIGGAVAPMFNNVAISGTLTAPAGIISVAGNWANSGTFNHGGGTVLLTGTGTSTISGNSTFNDLSCQTGGKQVNFEAGSTQTVNGSFGFSGASGTPLILRSTVPGTYWNIAFPNGPQTAIYVDVQDSNAQGNPVNAAVSTDSGHNSGWSFGSAKFWVSKNGGNWSDPGNWATTSGGKGPATPPGSFELAIFDNNSGKNKTCTLDAPVNVLGIEMDSTTVVINQGTSALTLGAGGLQMNSGTFNGGTAAVTTSGAIAVSGGTFRATSGTTNMVGTAPFLYSGGTFNHNGGTFSFNGMNTIVGGAATPTFNNVFIPGTLVGSASTVNVTGNWTNNGVFVHSGGTVAFTGTTTLGGTAATAFNNVTATGAVTAAANFSAAGNLTVSGGTVNIGAQAVSVDGTTSGTGTVQIGTGALTANGNYNMAGGSTTFTGAGSLVLTDVATSLGTLTPSTGTVLFAGTVAQSIPAAAYGRVDIANTSGSPVTLGGNRTMATLNILDGSLAVAGGEALDVTGGIALAGTSQLSLAANSTLRIGPGGLTAAAGTTFQAAGTSQLPGGYAVIEGTGGSYAMTLSGSVDVSFAQIYDLNASGLTLANASGTAAFDNVVFYDGAGGASPYLRVTGAAWDGHNFIGMGFSDVGGAKTRAIEIASGGTVYVTGYGSGAGWISGDASDIETSGQILWGPTAAEGLAAEVRRTPQGNRVTWTASAERGTMGYILLRRRTERASGLLEEETGGAVPAGHRCETMTGPWKVVAEMPPAAPGGEPVERSYSHLDKAPPGEWEYEVREVQNVGLPGAARASTKESRR